MKKIFLAAFIATALISCGEKTKKAETTEDAPTEEKVEFANNDEKLSYSLGVNSAKELANKLQQFGILNNIINKDLFAGVQDVFDSKPIMSNQELQQKMMALSQKIQTQQPFSEDEKKEFSYLIGIQEGQVIAGIKSQTELGDIFNRDIFMKGYIAVAENRPIAIEESEAIQIAQNYYNAIVEERNQKNKAEGEAFLAENTNKEGIVTTASGLQYEILIKGNGRKPTPSDRVKVHYHGTTLDGNVFDSSVDRGTPAEFGVTQVIAGWIEGLQLMPVGSKWRLYIPQELAYGANPNPRGPIQPYAMLIFELELLDIVSK